MGLITLTTSPATDLVSLAAIKAHCRVDGADNDDTLPGFIAAATDYIERAANLTLRPTTYRLTLDGFPAGREIVLPKPPTTGVQVVSYTDPAGDSQTLDTALYVADLAAGRVVLRSGRSWPASLHDPASVSVDYDAGYDAGSLPYTLRQAILLLAAYWFETREAATDRTFTELPLAVCSLIDLHARPEAA